MTKVAILWHMHQPYYEDLATGEHILPWVRLHALKDYYGMVALLREFPEVTLTFNLVPSLLVQLEAFAEERARDWQGDLGLKPASGLTEEERALILDEFFHAQHSRMIDPYPRYAELLRKRGEGSHAGKGGREFRDRMTEFTDADFLDLQVWHKLAWVDPLYLESDPRVQGLVEKGREFTESDKLLLREVELEIFRRIIPEYRSAVERRQTELSTSPFYHPILPLLCDSDIYLRTHPGADVPQPPFRRPEDAAVQLAEAKAYHERLFGIAPEGFWPPEGAVSDQVVALGSTAEFRWMATDEAILARNLAVNLKRDGNGRLEQPEILYRPYRIRAGSAEISCAFRDHMLSDLIGFTYASWRSVDAATDMVNRLVDAGRRFSARTGGEEATIFVILDGENAWEHYEGGGRPFLRSLYSKLSSHPELKTVTMSQATHEPTSSLNGIFPGSWIDGNFSIWMGHPDDQRAWRQLRDARDIFEKTAPATGASGLARAREEILIAEGSDWCWWYGDDHSSHHDLEFDDLFRRHLRNVYQALGKAIPEELFVTNISTSRLRSAVTPPVALVQPTLDGRVTSYFEWLAAGFVDTSEPTGTMQSGERHVPLVRGLLFGFDREHLYLRLDLSLPATEALSRGARCHVTFTAPPGRRLVICSNEGHATAVLSERTPDGQWADLSSTNVAVDDIVETSLAFVDLGLRPGDGFAFFVALHEAGLEIERHPAHRPIQARVPAQDFEPSQWQG